MRIRTWEGPGTGLLSVDWVSVDTGLIVQAGDMEDIFKKGGSEQVKNLEVAW